MTIVTVNSVLAAVGAGLLICVAARMSKGTCHRLRTAFALVFAGLAGDALSLIFAGWHAYVTTILYLGLIVWFIFNRRNCA